MESKIQSVFKCPVKGIGAFAANGNGRIFAFSEQKLNPSIFVYNYPELGLKNELKGKVIFSASSVDLLSINHYKTVIPIGNIVFVVG